MRKRTLSRETALKILYAWDITSEPLKECHEKFWKYTDAKNENVKEFSDFLVFGVEENLERLDELIAKHATNWRLDRMATIDRNILRIAAFELLFSSETPPKVTINEAIEMAKKYGDKDSGKFVNGILDNIKKTEEEKV